MGKTMRFQTMNEDELQAALAELQRPLDRAIYEACLRSRDHYRAMRDDAAGLIDAARENSATVAAFLHADVSESPA